MVSKLYFLEYNLSIYLTSRMFIYFCLYSYIFIFNYVYLFLFIFNNVYFFLIGMTHRRPWTKFQKVVPVPAWTRKNPPHRKYRTCMCCVITDSTYYGFSLSFSFISDNVILFFRDLMFFFMCFLLSMISIFILHSISAWLCSMIISPLYTFTSSFSS